MNIRNPGLYHSSFWDWSPFNDCFCNGIQISDIDGEVERNGYFLRIETKHPSGDVPTGQHRLFLALQRTQVFTILVVWGQKNRPERGLIYTKSGDRKLVNSFDFEAMHFYIKRWFAWANRQPKAQSPKDLLKEIASIRQELQRNQKLLALAGQKQGKRQRQPVSCPGQATLLPDLVPQSTDAIQLELNQPF